MLPAPAFSPAPTRPSTTSASPSKATARTTSSSDIPHSSPLVAPTPSSGPASSSTTTASAASPPRDVALPLAGAAKAVRFRGNVFIFLSPVARKDSYDHGYVVYARACPLGLLPMGSFTFSCRADGS
eukprot:UN1741